MMETRSSKVNLENAGVSERPAELEARFAPIAAKMERAGLPCVLIESFRYYYAQLLAGATGYIPSSEAQPVDHLPHAEELAGPANRPADREILDRTVVVKLNGGLGTSMGMERAKSLIEVKEGRSFLDLIVHQILHMRRRHGSRLPLVLMNSFNTRAETLTALAGYPSLREQDVPLEFLQHKVPKIWKSDLAPAQWPQDPEKEWCPPGHGDIYLALQTSGLLKQLLQNGYEYAFVSNSDNLGATVDLDILGYFAARNLPFLMEVARRTPADRKGGHLAHSEEKGLILREVAQCPPDEMDAFQDIRHYRYFNTNNLWIHLPTLKQTLDERHGVLALPLIRNEKPVDPTQPDSPLVYQLETAMGQAIAIFPNGQAVQVSRARFLPVKTTDDLLALWSDAYVLDDDYRILPNPARDSNLDPVVELDERYYRLFDQIQERFPYGAPSMLHCSRLQVSGNVYFGANVVLKGDVQIQHPGEEPLQIEDGRLIQDKHIRELRQDGPLH